MFMIAASAGSTTSKPAGARAELHWEFLRLGNPLNCGAWDKKLLKQYRVHKPSSLSYDAEMRSLPHTDKRGRGGFSSGFKAPL
ncbi:hypothetical protein INR49_023146 [Caranx melampygus]|nr:hypothetical protein INR49_023146 [Caranx melampygus]